MRYGVFIFWLAWVAGASPLLADEPVDVTDVPGVNTAVAAGAQITSAAASGTGSTSALPCPPVPALLTQVTACPNIAQVTRPNVNDDAGTARPACDGMPNQAYQQLLQFNIRGYELMNQRRALIAQRMTCLLGVPVSEAQVVDGLAQLANGVCDTSGASSRKLVISCGSSGLGAAASFSGGPNSSGDFCGTLLFNPDVVTRIRNQERVVNQMAMTSPNYQAATNQLELYKQDLVDGIIHENAHALASLLQSRIPGASMSSPPNRTCSVGPLMQEYVAGCRFFDGERDARLRMRMGTPTFDRDHYRPYADITVIEAAVPRLERSTQRNRARAERLRAQATRRTLSFDDRRVLETYDFEVEQLARFRVERPCAEAEALDPVKYMYRDLDQAAAGCGVVPSGRYRNEATARSLARDIVGMGAGCTNARTTMFGSSGTP